MFALAVRHGAIPANPVRETGRLRRPRRTVRALTVEHLQAVRAAIREWQQPTPGKPGPRPTGDLADIVDLMLATGARIGEILALRWDDLDLTAARPTLTICGTIVFVTGKGFFRQPWTKSDAGYRTVVLPRFAVGMLLARKLIAADNPSDAIFASRRGTWLSPNNVRRQWRQARADTDLGWVTPHTFRKTVATLIDREADTKSAAAQLGHASEEVTGTYYIEKPAIAPDVSEILEQLGADPTQATRHNDDNR
jgi:integrase